MSCHAAGVIIQENQNKEVWLMLYCEDCLILCRDENSCPVCGSAKLRPPKPDDPVLLITVWENDAVKISAAFDDASLPYMKRNMNLGGASPVILGKSKASQTRLFVPYGEMGHAEDILHGIGIIKDEPNKNEQEDISDKESGKKQKAQAPLSRGKQTAARIISALLFLLLIWGVVSASDVIAAWIKSLF
ncbi:MAG TPA: hypothetical protein DG942_01710 [Ruminococcaceae bacterium]|nr:hypothetical protein [Oscillospiraceae bacterium]